MTITATLPGVDRHGAGYRVRLRFDGAIHIECGLPTAEAANRRILELRELRATGATPQSAPTRLTLAQAAGALLARKRVSGRRHNLRARGLEYWQRSLKPWQEGPFAETPLQHLRRDQLEDAILIRAADHPTSARNELQALKALLEYAADRGAQFDQAILRISPVAVQPRQRRALTVDELEWFASHAPEYGRRLILIQGTVGNRIGELFSLDETRLDLQQGTLHVPAHLCKEGVAKTIPLTREEVHLLREQLLARAPGTTLVFPTKTGRQWRHNQYEKFIWAKAVQRASAAWRERCALAAEASTPFEWFEDGERRWITTHDLRATAATLMRDAGLTRDEAAARLGHADSGELLDRVYDVGSRAARVERALAASAPAGLRATLGART